MTIFNLTAVIKKIEDKRVFVEDAMKSVAKQSSVIANTNEKLSSLTMAQTIGGELVDMAAMAEAIFAREDKKVTAVDRAIFAFFGVPLKSVAVEISNDRVDELLKAKKERLDSNSFLKAQYNNELEEHRALLATIVASKAKAENELATILETLPDDVAAMLHASAEAVCEGYGQAFNPTCDDVLKRVEKSFFTFKRKEGKRVGLKVDIDGLKGLKGLVSAMKRLETVHSGMSAEQRASLFEGFDKSNRVFKDGELPSVNTTPVKAPEGFTGEAAHAVPKEPAFKSLSSFFNSVDGSLVVNCMEGIEILNNLVHFANEKRGWTMLKAVKEHRKNPMAALIETIDSFDFILQGYINVALQEFVNSGTHSQLDRLFTSPTMLNGGLLTPYGKQVKSYIACVMPYITLKVAGEGAAKTYFFEAVKSTRFAKLEISDKVGFYCFGARSKAEKDGQIVDARLPTICIRSHYLINKALRDLKRADDARVKEAHAKEWAEYREKYGSEYTKHTLQSEIDSLTSLLASKSKDLANLG